MSGKEKDTDTSNDKKPLLFDKEVKTDAWIIGEENMGEMFTYFLKHGEFINPLCSESLTYGFSNFQDHLIGFILPYLDQIAKEKKKKIDPEEYKIPRIKVVDKDKILSTKDNKSSVDKIKEHFAQHYLKEPNEILDFKNKHPEEFESLCKGFKSFYENRNLGDLDLTGGFKEMKIEDKEKEVEGTKRALSLDRKSVV